MSEPRAIVISDIHLSRERPFFFHNWDLTVEWINEQRPDLVVCCGDLALNAPVSPTDLTFAAEQLARLLVPVISVPGNHDVGNNHPDVRGEHVFSSKYRDAYLEVFGRDRFSHDLGSWVLVGLNSLMLGSHTPAEAEQLVWLDNELGLHRGRPIALVMHKPLFLFAPEETELHQGCNYPEPRRVLLELLRRHGVSTVFSGHNHEVLDEVRHGIRMIWAPSTAFINDGGRPTRGGGLRKQGLLDVRFAGAQPAVTLVTLDDMMTIDIGSWLTHGIGGYERNTAGVFRRP